MMDASPLYPNGYHPVRRYVSVDVIENVKSLARIDHPVRYYYIDFGLSVHFAGGASSLVVGDVGRDNEVPELSSTVPYDGYKADIYALGNLFHKEFDQVCRIRVISLLCLRLVKHLHSMSPCSLFTPPLLIEIPRTGVSPPTD